MHSPGQPVRPVPSHAQAARPARARACCSALPCPARLPLACHVRLRLRAPAPLPLAYRSRAPCTPVRALRARPRTPQPAAQRRASAPAAHPARAHAVPARLLCAQHAVSQDTSLLARLPMSRYKTWPCNTILPFKPKSLQYKIQYCNTIPFLKTQLGSSPFKISAPKENFILFSFFHYNYYIYIYIYIYTFVFLFPAAGKS